MKTIKHVELYGGSCIRKKIIIDTCELYENQFETIAIHPDSQELDVRTTETEEKAIHDFDEMFMKYAGEMQKAIYTANLRTSNKYTLVYLNEFGFSIVQKITLRSVEYTTYAQFGDAVKLSFVPYRKRKVYQMYFYDCSIMIFAGWQDIKETDTKDILKDDGIKIVKSKYSCFDARYIDDIENILKIQFVFISSTNRV